MSKTIVVHSMEELTKLLREMKDTKNVRIRVEYGKEGEDHAEKADAGPAVSG